jgi:Flp pilus assembly protein TadD
MADVSAFGLDAGRHHLVSLALHAANALLLFAALLRLTGAFGRSLLVAALFAVHPLHVESVAWISERKDLLAGLFWMLGLLAWAEYARAPSRARYAAVFAAMALGLLAKPMLVTFPFVLLLLDRWPLGRAGGPAAARRLVLEKAPLFALSAASCVLTLLAQRGGSAVVPVDALPLPVRLANAPLAWAGYVGKAIFPARLAVLYPHSGGFPGLPALAASAALLAALSVAAFLARRRAPAVPVGWLWFLGTLVPVIGIVQVGYQSMADRYAYIPLIGLYVAAAWGIPALLPDRHRRHAWALAVPAVLALAAATHVQAGNWRDTRTLFEHARAVVPENWLAECWLGRIEASEGNEERAAGRFRRALEILPGIPEAENGLGEILMRRGRTAEAVARFRSAVASRPGYAEAWANLAFGLAAGGDLDGAARSLEQALRADPDSPGTLSNLGYVRWLQGRTREAEARFREALARKPELEAARVNLERLLAGEPPPPAVPQGATATE